jgi:hypothetical protein
MNYWLSCHSEISSGINLSSLELQVKLVIIWIVELCVWLMVTLSRQFLVKTRIHEMTGYAKGSLILFSEKLIANT